MTYQRQPESSDEDALWRQRARQELIQALNPPLSAGGLIRLHSRYKYALMAYSPQLYKSSGRLLSQAGKLSWRNWRKRRRSGSRRCLPHFHSLRPALI